MPSSKDILKIKYVFTRINPDTLSVDKTVYELLSDGKILVKKYPGGSRKYESKKVLDNHNCEDYIFLCNRLNSCIDNATDIDWFIDDCSGTLTLYREFGIIETLDRGIRSNEESVGNIIYDYLFAEQ